jgi:hypothetical protein
MKNTAIWLSVAALLPALIGCGRGEYEKRLDARVEQIKKGSAFGEMQVAVSLANPELKLGTGSARLPKQFTALSPADGSLDQRRLKPPGYVPRGHAATCEAFVVDSTGGKISYYCYLGAATLRERELERMEFVVRNPFNQSYSDTTITWDQADALTTTGAAVEWKRARLEQQQEFYYVDAQGAESYRMAPAFYELWYRLEGDVLLTVAWRVPTDFAPNAEFEKWAPRVAGTVTFKAAEQTNEVVEGG